MRNPERIHPILHELKFVWRANPDLRLGQIIVNAASLGSDCGPTLDVFNIEDDVFETGLKRLADMRMQKDTRSRLHPTEMTREQRLFLVNLNARLAKIEQQYKKEALALIDMMNTKVESDADWIHDYEIECKIHFSLNTSDSAYKEDEDNFLAEIRDSLGGMLMHFGESEADTSNENWNDLHIPDLDNPEQEEHHCWLFHHLCDHSALSGADLLRIGSIWVDVNLTLQHFHDMTDQPYEKGYNIHIENKRDTLGRRPL
jgi:hypothetical protein